MDRLLHRLGPGRAAPVHGGADHGGSPAPVGAGPRSPAGDAGLGDLDRPRDPAVRGADRLGRGRRGDRRILRRSVPARDPPARRDDRGPPRHRGAGADAAQRGRLARLRGPPGGGRPGLRHGRRPSAGHPGGPPDPAAPGRAGRRPGAPPRAPRRRPGPRRRRRGGAVRHRPGLPDDPAGPPLRGCPGRPAGRRTGRATDRDPRLPGDPRLARGPGPGTHRAAPGDRAPGERGVLPHAGAQHLGRDPHRRGRRHDPVRQPVRRDRLRHRRPGRRPAARAGRPAGAAARRPGAGGRADGGTAGHPRPLVGQAPGGPGRGGGAVQRLPGRTDRGRPGGHPARRDGATPAGARADPAGLSRLAHRPAQPDTAAGADRASPAARAARVVPDLSALRRPRRLQAGQRHARALGRRPSAGGRRRPAVQDAAAQRHRRPTRRRRVRRPDGGRPRTAGRRAAGRSGDPDADPAVRPRRGVGQRLRQRRGGHGS